MTDLSSTAAELLAKMQAERGYVLSYHVIYGHLEPDFLDRYAGVYRYANLTPRFLTDRDRELCWVALLAAQREPIGSLHIDRARSVGLSDEDLAASIAVAAVADSWPTIGFAARQWPVGESAEALYGRLLAAAQGPLSTMETDLIGLVIQGVRRREDAFVHHLGRVLETYREHQAAEALTYIQLQAGNNAWLWCTDRWLDALRDGRLPESPTFGKAAFNTKVD